MKQSKFTDEQIMGFLKQADTWCLCPTEIAAVQSVVVTANGDTAFWIDNGSTYVFNNSTAGDVVVQLVAQTGATSLLTTNAVTDLGIHIM